MARNVEMLANNTWPGKRSLSSPLRSLSLSLLSLSPVSSRTHFRPVFLSEIILSVRTLKFACDIFFFSAFFLAFMSWAKLLSLSGLFQPVSFPQLPFLFLFIFISFQWPGNSRNLLLPIGLVFGSHSFPYCSYHIVFVQDTSRTHTPYTYVSEGSAFHQRIDL